MTTKRMMALTWLLGAMILGCADQPADSVAPIAVERMSARWTLDRVDDRALPASIEVEPRITRELLSGQMTTEADGTWTLRYDHHDTGETVDRTATSGATGLYELHAGEPVAVTLTGLDPAETWPGTLRDGTTLEVFMGGHRWGFTRAR